MKTNLLSLPMIAGMIGCTTINPADFAPPSEPVSIQAGFTVGDMERPPTIALHKKINDIFPETPEQVTTILDDDDPIYPSSNLTPTNSDSSTKQGTNATVSGSSQKPTRQTQTDSRIAIKTTNAPPTKAQIQACVDYAKENYAWKDKESVRADSAKWGESGGGSKGGVLVLELNAKNSYGAYSGTNTAVCQLNGKKVETMGYIKEKGGIIWR